MNEASEIPWSARAQGVFDTRHDQLARDYGPLVVGSSFVENTDTSPPLDKCRWVSLYPMTLLLLEKLRQAEMPPAEFAWDLPPSEISNEFASFRQEQNAHFVQKFVHGWGFAKYLLGRGAQKAADPGDSNYTTYNDDSSLFGLRVYTDRSQVEEQITRWKTAPELKLGDQPLPFHRIVTSRGIDLICSELFANAFKYGQERNPGGPVVFATKLYGLKSPKEANRADKFMHYLTDEEKSIYKFSEDHKVPLLELIIADTGRGFGGQDRLTRSFAETHDRPHYCDAELISHALTGRYSSAEPELIRDEYKSYPINPEMISPEVHGLAGVRRFVRESSAYWRIHSGSSLVDLNFLESPRITSRLINTLQRLGVPVRVLHRLADKIGREIETLEALTRFVGDTLPAEEDRPWVELIKQGILHRYRSGIRNAGGCIHHLILPLHETFDGKVEPASNERLLQTIVLQPHENTVGEEDVRTIDITRAITASLSPTGFHKALERLLQEENQGESLHPLLLNVGSLGLLDAKECAGYCPFLAYWLQQESSRRPVFLTELDQLVEDVIVRTKCIQDFFLDRRVIPVIVSDLRNDRYRLRILCSDEVKRIERHLLSLLSLQPFRFVSFHTIPAQEAELLWQVCAHNEGLFEVRKDAQEKVVACRIRIEGRNRETAHLLFGGMDRETFLARLDGVRGVARAQPPKLRILRCGVDIPQYLHLARILTDKLATERIVRWMENVLCHHADLAHVRRGQGDDVVLVAILEPAIELAKLLVERSWYFSRAHVQPVRNLAELSWEAQWCLRLAGKKVIGVVDLCVSYETIGKLNSICRYLGVEHLQNLTVVGQDMERDKRHHCISFCRMGEPAT